jgi:hypothetical protein
MRPGKAPRAEGGRGEETSPQLRCSSTPDQRVGGFLMCFYITFGSILASFSHQSACFPAPFSSLFRSCSAKGALFGSLSPFGSSLVAFRHPFGSHLGSRCSLVPPFWSPLARWRSVWLRRRSISDTFGFQCFPFVTFLLKVSLFQRFPSSFWISSCLPHTC